MLLNMLVLKHSVLQSRSLFASCVTEELSRTAKHCLILRGYRVAISATVWTLHGLLVKPCQNCRCVVRGLTGGGAATAMCERTLLVVYVRYQARSGVRMLLAFI
jgi:hypothetical protein